MAILKDTWLKVERVCLVTLVRLKTLSAKDVFVDVAVTMPLFNSASVYRDCRDGHFKRGELQPPLRTYTQIMILFGLRLHWPGCLFSSPDHGYPSPKKTAGCGRIILVQSPSCTKDSDSIAETGLLESSHVQALFPSVTSGSVGRYGLTFKVLTSLFGVEVMGCSPGPGPSHV